jgi:hypothetical protein
VCVELRGRWRLTDRRVVVARRLESRLDRPLAPEVELLVVRFGDVERVERFDVLVLPFPRLGPGFVALDGEGHQFAERGDGRVVTDSRSDDALPSANVAASVSLGPGALPS